MSKASQGNFFEDFSVGQIIRHATPRTITAGDVAVYNALFGPRFAVQSSEVFAQAIGYPQAPVDDLLVFHIVFGKTVPDISLNAVANLGYANCRFSRRSIPATRPTRSPRSIRLKGDVPSRKRPASSMSVSSASPEDGAVVFDYVRSVT